MTFFLLLLVAYTHTGAQPGVFSVKVNATKEFRNDTIIFTYWPLYYAEMLHNMAPHSSTLNIHRKNIFRFRTGVLNHPAYFSLAFGRKDFVNANRIIDRLFCIPGDSLEVVLGKDSILFKGSNAAFYQCQLQLQEKITASENHIGKGRMPIDSSSYLQFYLKISSECTYVYNEAFNLLKRYQHLMPLVCFQLLQTDITGYLLNGLISSYVSMKNNMASHFLNKKNSIPAIGRLTHAYDSILGTITDLSVEKFRAVSEKYYQYSFQKLKLEAGNKGMPVFAMIQQAPDGLNKDKWFVSHFLAPFFIRNDSLGSQLTLALSMVKNGTCRQVLQNMQQRQVTGSPAFAFALPDAKGKLVRLSDLKGKAILLDFWFTGCSGCSYNYKEVLGPIERKYRNDPRIVFVSVSTDRHRSRWLKSIAEDIYTSQHAVNLHTGGAWVDHDLIRAYGVISFPFLVLINRQGKLVSINQAALRNKTTLEKMIESLL